MFALNGKNHRLKIDRESITTHCQKTREGKSKMPIDKNERF